MIVIVLFFTGIALGAYRARAKDGNRKDMLQFGAVYGLIFAVVGVFVTLLVGRLV